MLRDSTSIDNQTPEVPKGGAKRYVIVGGVALAAAALGLGILPRLSHEKELRAESIQASHRVLRVEVAAARLESDSVVTLPGNIQSVSETPIYARASGYIVKRYVDIGSRVRKGQVLVDIESPDARLNLEQARADTNRSRATVVQSQSDVEKLRAGVAQANADLARSAAATQQSRAMIVNAQSRVAQAKANRAAAASKLAASLQMVEGQKAAVQQAAAQFDLAEATAKRYRGLLEQGFVTQQEDDQAQATFKIARAGNAAAKSAVGAAMANVQSAREEENSAQAAVDATEADVRSSQENLKASLASEGASRANVKANEASLRSGQSFVNVNRSGVNSLLASEKRFTALSSFQQLRAPFDGVITARNVDVGTLVAAGAGAVNQSPTTTTSNMGLFGLARTDELRIQVSVPQAYIQLIEPRTRATVTVQELPGQSFEGTVAVQSGALDSTSRTRFTEIRLQNKRGVLLPGMFAKVSFATGGKVARLRVPANTLDVGAHGTRVAIVQKDKTLHFVTVTLGRDFGAEAEVLQGLKGKEALVTNLTNEMHEGMLVEVSSVAK